MDAEAVDDGADTEVATDSRMQDMELRNAKAAATMVHDSSPSTKARRNSPQLSKSISSTTHVPDDEPGIA
eukprot:scaffold103987_cov20-Attheya_sp.AAC.1